MVVQDQDGGPTVKLLRSVTKSGGGEKSFELGLKSVLKGAGKEDYLLLTRESHNTVSVYTSGQLQDIHKLLGPIASQLHCEDRDVVDGGTSLNQPQMRDAFISDEPLESHAAPFVAGGGRPTRVNARQLRPLGRNRNQQARGVTAFASHRSKAIELRAGITAATKLEEAVPQTHAQLVGFSIGEEKRVKDCLTETIIELQQQVLKQMAKAWIKGICPKKQARYPYLNKQQKKDQTAPDTGIPRWWPPVEDCPYVEPDHVNKSERIKLCLHILRLRPTLQELEDWRGQNEPHQTHIQRGWTAFLEGLTPMSVFEGLAGEPKDKIRRREELMREMYKMASKEEDYLLGGCDKNDMIALLNEASTKSFSRKRRHGAVTSDDKASKPSVQYRSAKRVKTRSSHPSADVEQIDRVDLVLGANVTHNSAMVTDEPALGRGPTPERMAQDVKPSPVPDYHSGLYGHSATRDPYAFEPFIGFEKGIDTRPDSTPNTSFSSIHSSHDGVQDTYQVQEPPSTFRGMANFGFGPKQSPIQVNMVAAPFTTFSSHPRMPATCAEMLHFDYNNEYGIVQEPGVSEYGGSTPPFGTPVEQYGASELASNEPQFGRQKNLGPRISYGFMSDAYARAPFHGLPLPHSPKQGMPNNNHGDRRFSFPDQMPDSKFPPDALPSSVMRGFTDHHSGVGDAPWF